MVRTTKAQYHGNKSWRKPVHDVRVFKHCPYITMKRTYRITGRKVECPQGTLFGIALFTRTFNALLDEDYQCFHNSPAVNSITVNEVQL